MNKVKTGLLTLSIALLAVSLHAEISPEDAELNRRILNDRPTFDASNAVDSRVYYGYGALGYEYAYSVKLSGDHENDIAPHLRSRPWAKTGPASWLGYAGTSATIEIIMEENLTDEDDVMPTWTDPVVVATLPFSLGSQTVMHTLKGIVSNSKVELTVTVEEKDANMLITESGTWWNSYGPAKAYIVKVTAKKAD